MPPCPRLTEDGKLCPNQALPNSDYCKSHRLPGKQNFCKKVWDFIHTYKVDKVFVCMIAAYHFSGSTVQHYDFFTQNTIKDVQDGTQHIYYVVQNVDKNTQEVADTLLKPKKINTLLREEVKEKHVLLMKEYPLGYALIYVDNHDIYAPKIASEFVDIDLNGAKILAYKDDYVTLSIPQVKLITLGNAYKTDFVLIRGVENEPIPLTGFTISPAMSARILIDKKDYVIGVIGFSKSRGNY